MPSVITVAESDSDESAFGRDRRAFQLKERITPSDPSDPHVAAPLIERISWALTDAEDTERVASGP